MTKSTIDSQPSSRRERRAAARHHATAHSGQPAPGMIGRLTGVARRSPIASLTVGVVLVAVVAIAGLQLLQRPTPVGTAAGTRTAAGILVPYAGTPDGIASGRSLGRADAPVTLTVWSDFQCPACRTFAINVEPRLITDYITAGKLRLSYRDLLIIGPESHDAAIASRCADEQNAFWPFHDVLFANQAAENSGALTPARLRDMADAVGLDRTSYDACIADPSIKAQVDAETAQGLTRGQSTPTLDFGKVVVAGAPAYPDLSAKIDALVAAAGK